MFYFVDRTSRCTLFRIIYPETTPFADTSGSYSSFSVQRFSVWRFSLWNLHCRILRSFTMEISLWASKSYAVMSRRRAQSNVIMESCFSCTLVVATSYLVHLKLTFSPFAKGVRVAIPD
jgi:hypothetical protein